MPALALLIHHSPEDGMPHGMPHGIPGAAGPPQRTHGAPSLTLGTVVVEVLLIPILGPMPAITPKVVPSPQGGTITTTTHPDLGDVVEVLPIPVLITLVQHLADAQAAPGGLCG